MAAHDLTSTANVKTYAGISDASQDAVIALLITMCTDWIEKYCGGRRFKEETYTDEEYESRFSPDEIPKEKYINLKNYPITDTEPFELSERTGTSTYQVLTSDNYETYNDRGQVYLYGGLNRLRKGYRVTYSAGYATIPTDLEYACIKLVAQALERRRSEGKKSESIGGASISYMTGGELFAPDSEVANILSAFRRKF